LAKLSYSERAFIDLERLTEFLVETDRPAAECLLQPGRFIFLFLSEQAISLIGDVLIAGQFRSPADVNNMSHDGQRNTLIVEMANRSTQSNLQSFDDYTLAGMGALLVFLRTARIRDDAALKNMTADGMRNTLMVVLGNQPQLSGSAFQSMSNIELVWMKMPIGKRPKQCIWNKAGFTLDVTWLLDGKVVKNDRIMSGQGSLSNDNKTYTVILSIVDAQIADKFVKGLLGLAVGVFSAALAGPVLAAAGVAAETVAAMEAAIGKYRLPHLIAIMSTMGIPNPAGIYHTGTTAHGRYLDV